MYVLFPWRVWWLVKLSFFQPRFNLIWTNMTKGLCSHHANSIISHGDFKHMISCCTHSSFFTPDILCVFSYAFANSSRFVFNCFFQFPNKLTDMRALKNTQPITVALRIVPNIMSLKCLSERQHFFVLLGVKIALSHSFQDVWPNMWQEVSESI